MSSQQAKRLVSLNHLGLAAHAGRMHRSAETLTELHSVHASMRDHHLCKLMEAFIRAVIRAVHTWCIQELFQLNVFKGATSALRSANPIGWASLQLRDICRTPFERQEVELRCAEVQLFGRRRRAGG